MNNHLYQSENQKLHSGFAQCTGRERMARSPRVFASGDLKLLLLEFIGERPRHGYDLIQQIKGLFDGAYTPSPGVIYPALAFLEAGLLVSVEVQGEKSVTALPRPGISISGSKWWRLKVCTCALMSAGGHFVAWIDRQRFTRQCTTCDMPCNCIRGTGARKRSSAFTIYSITPPKPL